MTWGLPPATDTASQQAACAQYRAALAAHDELAVIAEAEGRSGEAFARRYVAGRVQRALDAEELDPEVLPIEL